MVSTKLERSKGSAFKLFTNTDDSIIQIRRIKKNPIQVVNFNLGSLESESGEDTADFVKECFLNDDKFYEECFLKEEKFSKDGFSFGTED